MSLAKRRLAAGPKANIAAFLPVSARPPWYGKVSAMTQVQLFKDYGREAAVHRDLMVSAAPVPSSWRNFRQFMLDAGPAPEGDGWILAVFDDTDKVYDPGRVRWTKMNDPLVLYWRKEGAQGAWNRERRTAKSIEDQLLSQLSHLDNEPGKGDRVDEWMPQDPDKQASFNKAFRLWHAHVKPNFIGSARPAFLFLYTALFVLVESRDELKAAGLWTNDPARADALHAHPAWNRYCDHLRRAEAALASLPEFGSYSLHTQLDDMLAVVVATEQQFRTG